jgi:hypothetical protein
MLIELEIESLIKQIERGSILDKKKTKDKSLQITASSE